MNERTTVKENYEFRRLYRQGASAVGRSMVLYARRNRRGCNRVGITVSAKIGKAVVRNRVRRRLREVFRLNAGEMKQGYDCILVARGRAVYASFPELQKQFLALLSELSLREATE